MEDLCKSSAARAPAALAGGGPMLCRLTVQDDGPLAAARRLREAAEAHLISVQLPQGRELTLKMALRCYQDALQAQPSDAIAFEQATLAVEVGQMLHEADRHGEAAAAFRSALRNRLLPDRPIAHGQLAEALIGLGDTRKALAEYARGLELAPTSEYLLAGLSSQQSLSGRDEEAAATARHALRANPSAHTAQYNLATFTARLGRPAEAERSYRRALAMQPTESTYYQGLGTHLHGLGRAGEAVRWYESARALMVARGEPPSVDLEYDVATAYREAGQLDEAVEAARRALELQPQQADGRVLLKAAYSEAGRHAEAHAVSAAARPSTQPEAPPPSAGRGTLRQGSVEVFMEVGLQDAGLDPEQGFR